MKNMKNVEKLLNDLTGLINAHLILLTTSKGKVLTVCGAVQSDKIESLCSLSAAQMGACLELAQALEISSSFTWLIREGAEFNLFLGTIAQNYILLLIVPAYTPLGVVRYLLNQNMPDLIILLTSITLKRPIRSGVPPFAMKLQQKLRFENSI
jgi:hypothetical protein